MLWRFRATQTAFCTALLNQLFLLAPFCSQTNCKTTLKKHCQKLKLPQQIPVSLSNPDNMVFSRLKELKLLFTFLRHTINFKQSGFVPLPCVGCVRILIFLATSDLRSFFVFRHHQTRRNSYWVQRKTAHIILSLNLYCTWWYIRPRTLRRR